MSSFMNKYLCNIYSSSSSTLFNKSPSAFKKAVSSSLFSSSPLSSSSSFSFSSPRIISFSPYNNLNITYFGSKTRPGSIAKKGAQSLSEQQKKQQGFKSTASALNPTKPVDPNLLYLVTVTAKDNNTFLNLAQQNGNTILMLTCGIAGFIGPARATYMANVSTAQRFALSCKTIGVKMVDLVFKGFSPNRRAVVKSLSDEGIKILRIEDKTPIPFNGCKPKKAKRRK